MPVSVTMPRLGESVSEGTVTRWLKKEGERVEVDEPLLEVSTDKVDTEIPSPASGVLTSIKVGEDATVEVGVELAVIDDAGGATGPTDTAPAESAPQPAAPSAADAAPAPVPAAPAPAAPVPAAPAPAAPASPVSPAAPTAEVVAAPTAVEPPAPSAPDQPSSAGTEHASEGAYVTPLVRKLAAEHDVDLAGIVGTGVGGRIRKQDVIDASASRRSSDRPAPAATGAAPVSPAPSAPVAAPAAPASSVAAAASAPPSSLATAAAVRGRTEPMSRLRKVIAERMVASLQTSAQLTTVLEVDLTRVALLRNRAKEAFLAREGVKLSFLPFFAKAAIEALRAHPVVNSSIDMTAGTVTYHDAEHLGIAVDTERGLLVPVIHQAGDFTLAAMARKIADLAERTRTNRISPDELGGGTFTLTNTGSRGALFDTPIINQPQSAILGTGSVVKRPVVVAGPDGSESIAIRSMVYLALSYDHRIVDGADAARFLTTMKERLEEGSFEADLGL